MKIFLHVKGMHCKSCEELIKMALEDLGAGAVSADHVKGVVNVEFDPSKITKEDISAAIKKEGYGMA